MRSDKTGPTKEKVMALMKDGGSRSAAEIINDTGIARNGLFAKAMRRLIDDKALAVVGTKLVGRSTQAKIYRATEKEKPPPQKHGDNPFLWRTYGGGK